MFQLTADNGWVDIERPWFLEPGCDGDVILDRSRNGTPDDHIVPQKAPRTLHFGLVVLVHR